MLSKYNISKRFYFLIVLCLHTQIINGAQFVRRNRVFTLYSGKRIQFSPKLSISDVNTAIKCAAHCFEVGECCASQFNVEKNICFLAFSESCTVHLETADEWTVISKSDIPAEHQNFQLGADCYQPDSSEYTGHVNVTVSGRQCQHWNTHSPNIVNIEPDDPADHATNYCRDPADYGTPFCFTMDIDEAWEFCPISKCDTCMTSPPIPEGTDVQYNMAFGYSVAYFTCQSLSTEASKINCPVSQCNDDGQWSDFNVSCGVDDCYVFSTGSTIYTGKVSCTILGEECLPWNIVNTPDKPLLPTELYTNYCRDPKGLGRPYCHIDLGDTYWEYCNVKKCPWG